MFLHTFNTLNLQLCVAPSTQCISQAKPHSIALWMQMSCLYAHLIFIKLTVGYIGKIHTFIYLLPYRRRKSILSTVGMLC